MSLGSRKAAWHIPNRAREGVAMLFDLRPGHCGWGQKSGELRPPRDPDRPAPMAQKVRPEEKPKGMIGFSRKSVPSSDFNK